jgi:hypothetical protein
MCTLCAQMPTTIIDRTNEVFACTLTAIFNLAEIIYYKLMFLVYTEAAVILPEIS